MVRLFAEWNFDVQLTRKFMKHIITIAVLLCVAVPAFAQDGKTHTGSVIVLTTPNYQIVSQLVESVTVTDGRLEVVRRIVEYPVAIPAVNCTSPPCDWTRRRVVKEIYGVKDGKLQLLETIEGKIIPAQAERVERPKP